ncbi:MAG TPA: hypothetical protein VHM91_04055 [Verrucomicrobiales bacterium]|jgi:ElaB/YqjD/DUF883 family membrane-anchored ribosome-binding protein|nr:hypothetical protein [Verrucomicrobiales bacterium]
MSSHPIRDTVDHLKDTARDAYDGLKNAAQDKIIDPLASTGRNIASAARHGAENVADYTRRTADRTGAWASANPYSAAGILFGAGLIAGVYLVSRCRR